MSKQSLDPKAQALRLLARREHSARELARKLTERGVDAGQAEDAVAYAAREGWQSELRYAEMLLRSRISRGYGPMRIEADLKVAGVPEDLIQSVLEGAAVDWRTLAAGIQAKRFRSLPKSPTERARQYRYLQGRGFDGSQIQAALKGETEL
jgi:regulatory protein